MEIKSIVRGLVWLVYVFIAIVHADDENQDTHAIQAICAGCRFDGGIGYTNHRMDCNKYVMCYKSGKAIRGVERDCGVGKFWDQALLTCRESKDVVCSTDICKNKPSGYTYGHAENCQAYWECSNGVSIGHCCPDGHDFSDTVGCKWSTTCNDTCGTKHVDIECDKEPVPDDDRKFRQRLSGGRHAVMSCAAGTVFRLSTCDCRFAVTPQVSHANCKKEVEMRFIDEKLKDNSGNNVYIYQDNVTISDGQGCFHGNSVIVISRFSNAYIGNELEIVVKFRPGYFANKGLQAIVYNGDCGFTPSIIVATDGSDIVFKLRNEQNLTQTLAQPVPKGKRPTEAIEAVFTLHRHQMRMSSGGSTVSTVFFGNVARSKCGLKLGWGEEYQSFTGCLSY
ncbi:PIF-like protein, partial [Mya arenaria]